MKKIIIILACILTCTALAESERQKLLTLLSGEWVSRGIYTATKLEIAEHLNTGPKTIEELAQLTNSNPESLYRLMHMLSGYSLFKESAPGVFTNTESSALLSKSHPNTLHALSLFYGEEIHHSWDEIVASLQTGTPAFQISYDQPVFSYFKQNPERAALFQEAMKEKSMAVIKSALSAYDFSIYNSLYDIGGGYGQFMKALLTRYPHLKGLLFDLPEVVNKVQLPCELCAGDFFVSIPEGGDAYLLKSVLHDWEDEKAEKILENCYRAMRPDSHLLIVEVVLLPDDQSIYANCMDFLMLAVTGGKERSLASFEKLLEKTGFQLEGIIPTDTEFSILKAKKRAI